MSVISKFRTAAEAKKANAFSRRHESPSEHRTAQDDWRAKHDPSWVAERKAERASRMPQQQIALLDQRLGVGQGAVKERARLKALVKKAK